MSRSAPIKFEMTKRMSRRGGGGGGDRASIEQAGQESEQTKKVRVHT